MLCHCVTAANRPRYSRQIDQMFRQRHKVFVEFMGWRELRKADGRDIDEYDTDDTVYLLVLDDGGTVVASTRMNPTWGRHQLEEGSDLRARFAHRAPPKGPHVWEGSRLIPGFQNRYGEEFARATMGILLAGVQEFCVRRSVTHGLSIMETAVKSKTNVGWDGEPLGLPVAYETDRGPGEANAGMWRAGMRYLIRTRQAFGIVGPVLFEAAPMMDEDEAPAPAFALLESVSELRTDEARLTALQKIHELLAQEAASPRSEPARKLN